jgi:hypothetical protein
VPDSESLEFERCIEVHPLSGGHSHAAHSHFTPVNPITAAASFALAHSIPGVSKYTPVAASDHSGSRLVASLVSGMQSTVPCHEVLHLRLVESFQVSHHRDHFESILSVLFVDIKTKYCAVSHSTVLDLDVDNFLKHVKKWGLSQGVRTCAQLTRAIWHEVQLQNEAEMAAVEFPKTQTRYRWRRSPK